MGDKLQYIQRSPMIRKRERGTEKAQSSFGRESKREVGEEMINREASSAATFWKGKAFFGSF